MNTHRATRIRMQRWRAAAGALSILLLYPAVALAQSEAQCSRLTSFRLNGTTVESAEVVEAGTFNPPGSSSTFRRLPPFCRATGVISPAIAFEIWMPLGEWTGRFEVVGNGGMAGTISYSAMANALRRGNAAGSTNTGHTTQPGNGFDASWSLNRPELVEDFGHRALHLTTVNGKQIVRQFYGKSADHSYYVGCSKGGGQGLMEAQRYPSDFDGIVAGDPAYNWTRLYEGAHLYYARSTLKDPESYLQPAKIKMLADAVNRACDAKDGIADGVLEEPLSCHFDPAVLACKEGQDPGTCFTPKQVKAVKDIWAGSRDEEGRQIFPGLVPGGEAGAGGWQSWVTGSAPFRATHWRAADSFFRYMVMGDPNYNALTFDYDRDKQALERLAPALDAVEANLRPFERHGSKLILYHGWSDPDISPLNTIHYYNAMQQATGPKTSDFARLFLVPGMQHCGGGPGTDSFDAVSAIERWVEEGIAPNQIVASHITRGVVDRTRPLCPYPQTATYTGKGPNTDAGSFVCRAPANRQAN
ncbi:tannase/feruloyl esterase family alpha/beta hydrolase [Edaphobacter sp. HDX4]|uniref:tannase/feruloyl esterase family alpha/beta hydrolase n=1 Tax=Edaphobacter sp. HDX4 TaxID=2794064 RepID=UPI002FE58D17